MEILIKAGQLLLSLSLLVVLHEMGHFLFAKLFKTRVEKFYLFFDPWFSLFKHKVGDTEYGIGWLPLGGYVKISGMIDESMDKEQMAKPPEPYEFRSKPAWQRLLIMLGGVLVNFITAFFIYSMILFTWGSTYLPTENAKYGIVTDTLAREMGLQDGDMILSVDHEKVEDFLAIVPGIIYDEAQSIQISRNGENMSIDIPEDFIPRFIQKKSFISYAFPFIIRDFSEESAAKNAGLKVDDRIIGIDGKETPFFDNFDREIQKYKDVVVPITVNRDGETLTFDVKINENSQMGVWRAPDAEFFTLKTSDYSFFESFPAGIKKGMNTISSYLKDLKLIFTPETEAYKSLGGFIAIGNIFPGQWSWPNFWNLTAFLSIMLAILNILPIPALDGGHVLFLTFEIITGRKPSDKFMEYAQIAGMILLLALVVFANGNDIIKLFTK